MAEGIPSFWPSHTNGPLPGLSKLKLWTRDPQKGVRNVEQYGKMNQLSGPGLSYDAAFTELYKSYYTRVFAFVYSRVGNVELSKDLTGEIFERAYVKGHTLREPAAYGAWLFMVAKNVVVGHYRRHKREANRMDRVRDSLWLADGPPDPEDSVVWNERIASLMRHFRTLPRRDQDLLSLKFDAELTYPEIAQVMGMKEVNARVSVFRALQRLRDRVQKERAGYEPCDVDSPGGHDLLDAPPGPPGRTLETRLHPE